LPDISFRADGTVSFPTKYHGEVTLSRQKWDTICDQSERFYYRHNGEKIPTTLVTPDFVRHHKDTATQFIYYKAFDKFTIVENVEGPVPCKFMAVVIDAATQRVCTVYPTIKPKSGSKEYKPEGA
jgi:hypothetical protein